MGWQSYPFLVAPEEFAAALEPFKLVISNACVPVDYTDTPIEEFIKGYSELYEQLISGQALNKSHTHLLKQAAITTDLSQVKFGMEHELDGKVVKAVINDRVIAPMPYLAPFTFMTYQENNKLYVSTRASYMAYTEFVFGYEVNFLKFSQNDASYYGLPSEKEFKIYPDYELFKKNIAKITKPFTFMQDGMVKKTSIRISDEVKMHLSELYCIKNKGIEIL